MEGSVRGNNQSNSRPDPRMGGPECGDVNSEELDLWHNRSAWKEMIKKLEVIFKKQDSEATVKLKQEYAEKVIEFYNKEKGVDYELVKVVAGLWFYYYDLTFHVNLQAKLKNSTSPPELFFAEISIDGKVTCCTILEPEPEELSEDMIIENMKKCQVCDVPILHPDNGFRSVSVPEPLIDVEEFLAERKRRRELRNEGKNKDDGYPRLMDEAKEKKKVKECAKKALEYYNKEKNLDYEFVEFLEGNCIRYNRQRWFHVNFGAKLKNSTSGPELFFAESTESFEFTCCTILSPEPEEIPDDMKVLCSLCHFPVLHPYTGFRAACIPYVASRGRQMTIHEAREEFVNYF